MKNIKKIHLELLDIRVNAGSGRRLLAASAFGFRGDSSSTVAPRACWRARLSPAVRRTRPER